MTFVPVFLSSSMCSYPVFSETPLGYMPIITTENGELRNTVAICNFIATKLGENFRPTQLCILQIDYSIKGIKDMAIVGLIAIFCWLLSTHTVLQPLCSMIENIIHINLVFSAQLAAIP